MNTELESAHKVKSGEENSPAAPAGIRTRNLSITSSVLLPTSYPGSFSLPPNPIENNLKQNIFNHMLLWLACRKGMYIEKTRTIPQKRNKPNKSKHTYTKKAAKNV